MEGLISSPHTPEYCLAHILGWTHSTLEVTDCSLHEKKAILTVPVHRAQYKLYSI